MDRTCKPTQMQHQLKLQGNPRTSENGLWLVPQYQEFKDRTVLLVPHLQSCVILHTISTLYLVDRGA